MNISHYRLPLAAAAVGLAAGLAGLGLSSASPHQAFEFANQYGVAAALAMATSVTTAAVGLPITRSSDSYTKRIAGELQQNHLSEQTFESFRKGLRAFNLLPVATVVGLSFLSITSIANYPEFAMMFSSMAVAVSTMTYASERLLSDWVASRAEPVANKIEVKNKIVSLVPEIDKLKSRAETLRQSWQQIRKYPLPEVDQKFEDFDILISRSREMLGEIEEAHLKILADAKLRTLVEQLATMGELLDVLEDLIDERSIAKPNSEARLAASQSIKKQGEV